MQVRAVFGQLHFFRTGHPVVAPVFGAEHLHRLTHFFRFFKSFVRERTGVGIRRRHPFFQKVAGHAAELQAATAAHKEDAVIVRQIQQIFYILFGFFQHFFKCGAAMADLQDGHPGIVKIQQFRLYFFQNFQRQGRRARVKIEYPAHVDYSFSLNYI